MIIYDEQKNFSHTLGCKNKVSWFYDFSMRNCWNCFHNWVHQAATEPQESEEKADFQKIANWLAMKSKKICDLVMTAWFTLEEAPKIKSVNPKAKLLAGLTVNWV